MGWNIHGIIASLFQHWIFTIWNYPGSLHLYCVFTHKNQKYLSSYHWGANMLALPTGLDTGMAGLEGVYVWMCVVRHIGSLPRSVVQMPIILLLGCFSLSSIYRDVVGGSMTFRDSSLWINNTAEEGLYTMTPPLQKKRKSIKKESQLKKKFLNVCVHTQTPHMYNLPNCEYH